MDCHLPPVAVGLPRARGGEGAKVCGKDPLVADPTALWRHLYLLPPGGTWEQCCHLTCHLLPAAPLGSSELRPSPTGILFFPSPEPSPQPALPRQHLLSSILAQCHPDPHGGCSLPRGLLCTMSPATPSVYLVALSACSGSFQDVSQGTRGSAGFVPQAAPAPCLAQSRQPGTGPGAGAGGDSDTPWHCWAGVGRQAKPGDLAGPGLVGQSPPCLSWLRVPRATRCFH